MHATLLKLVSLDHFCWSLLAFVAHMRSAVQITSWEEQAAFSAVAARMSPKLRHILGIP